MLNEMQKNLPDRVKDFLQDYEEHSLFELAEILRQFRNNSHPDKFQDDKLKKEAENRFKEANSLLQEIEKQLEIDRFNRKPAELVLYKPFYDLIQLQSELDKIKIELEETKSELSSERKNNDELRKEIQTEKDDSLNAEIQHLQSLYTPSTRKYASLGIGIILSGALGIMTQMENVSIVLQKYSPFEQQYMSTGFFIFLILFLATILRKLWESEYMKRKSEQVCSPKCNSDFMEYLRSTRDSDEPIIEFSEVDVFDFISGDKKWLKGLASFLGFSIFRSDTVNKLKDIFIHTALNKKLIGISRADGMQRYFTISSSRAHYIWYHEYMERRKNEESNTEDS